MKIYRQGAVGALLDEYERTILELQKVIADVSDHDLTKIVDAQTKDANCKSIQTILSHVVSSGYGYATDIHKCKGHIIKRPDKTFHLTVKEYIKDLTKVFEFTSTIFKDIKDSELEIFDNSQKIKTSWGQLYDIEQLTEHAIVHILRHRRQIEKFKNSD